MIGKLILIFISAATLFAACSHSSKTSKNLFIQIKVEHLKQNYWRVTYKTDRPVYELVFDRSVNLFRTENWKPLSPDIHIAQKHSKEVITSHSSFREASFEFQSYFKRTPKDYEFFRLFSDGSVVMYTGHFNIYAEGVQNNFSFQQLSSERIVLNGKVHSTPISSVDLDERGTYVYFGNLVPLESSHFTAILDPNLPQNILKNLNTHLSQIFDYYVEKTGVSIPFTPFIFLSFDENSSGCGKGGGTLPGLIQMHLTGKCWHKMDEDAFAQLIRFFAHEAAHIWNGQLFPYVSGDMWMHEGGADAFSYIILHDKILKKSRFEYHKRKAYEECLNHLNARPLRMVTEDPEYMTYYKCGSILAFMTGAAVNKQNPSDGVFTFWNELFKEVQKNKQPYSEKIYFKILDQLSGEENTSSSLKLLLDGPTNNPKEIFEREFKRLNLIF